MLFYYTHVERVNNLHPVFTTRQSVGVFTTRQSVDVFTTRQSVGVFTTRQSVDVFTTRQSVGVKSLHVSQQQAEDCGDEKRDTGETRLVYGQRRVSLQSQRLPAGFSRCSRIIM